MSRSDGRAIRKTVADAHGLAPRHPVCRCAFDRTPLPHSVKSSRDVGDQSSAARAEVLGVAGRMVAW